MAKRITKKPKTHKSLIDDLVYIAAIGYPLMTTPQIIHIYQNKSAEDLHIVTWVFYLLFEILFFSYGVKHKLKPIIITGLLWFVFYSAVIVGILAYG